MTDNVQTYTIDLIPGDGIGIEVIPPAVAAVNALGDAHGFRVNWRERPWGSAFYRAHHMMMPADGLDQMADGDGILLGAVGDPDIADTVTLWGLLIPIRRRFQQYVNLRPSRTLPGVRSPIGDTAFDMMIVRENVEGEYSEIGGRFNQGTREEAAVQESVFTRRGVSRVARFAARLAADRSGTIVSATKSNGILHTMPFWDEIVDEVGAEEGVAVDKVLIDALAARFVLRPQSLDVVVASNLFGDILSDLAAALAGSLGIAPSANLNPEREHPSLFEPVHGSAPDIAGLGVANPVAAMWAAAMMLDHLGQASAARELEAAVFAPLAQGISTRDLGGDCTTEDYSAHVLERLRRV